jgi:hypothetical protein
VKKEKEERKKEREKERKKDWSGTYASVNRPD